MPKVLNRIGKLSWVIINKKCSNCGNHLRKEYKFNLLACSYSKCKYKNEYKGK